MNDSYPNYDPRHRSGWAPVEPPPPPPPPAPVPVPVEQPARQHVDQHVHPPVVAPPLARTAFEDDYENYEYDDYFDEPRRHRSYRSVIAALVALIVIVGALGFGGMKAYHFAKDHLGGSGGDYSASDTHGHVTYTVKPSESGTQMARELKALGVVKSVDSFISAYDDNNRAGSISPGTYRLELGMPAATVVTAMLDHNNVVQDKIVIREGLPTSEVVALLDKQTKYTAKDFKRVLAHPATLGLPASAAGRAEGYLFPATYGFAPGTKPADMLSQMVSAWHDETAKLGLKDTLIDGHQYTVQQLMTVASLVQEEGKTPADMAKIARVIYNRIENPGAEGTTGKLEIDATVDYAMKRPLTLGLTQEQRETTDSPYNTFLHTGLPPGPIGNPGLDAIKAALHPAHGDWYYYITVNLATGKTKFAETYDQFLTYQSELQTYCATQSASGCQ